jgi:hypothetical protein
MSYQKMLLDRSEAVAPRPAGLRPIERGILVAKLVNRCAVPALLRGGLPLNILILIAAVIIFGPQGLSAHQVTHLMRADPGIRIALWSGWVLLTLPVAGRLLTLPSALYLKSLPIPNYLFSMVSGVHLLSVNAAWTLLWWRGSGALSGCSAAATAVAAHSLLVSRRWRLREWLAGTAVALAMGASLPDLGALGIGIAGAVVGLSAAWRTAPERQQGAWRVRASVRPVLALSFAHLLRLVRVEGALFWRAFLLLATFAIWPIASIRNNATASGSVIDRIVLATEALPFLAAVVPMLLAVRAADLRDASLFVALAVPVRARLLAAGVVMVACGGFLAAGCGIAIGVGIGGEAASVLRLAALEVAWVLGLVALVAPTVWADSSTQRTRWFVYRIGALGSLATVGAAVLGAIAPVVTLAIASIRLGWIALRNRRSEART